LSQTNNIISSTSDSGRLGQLISQANKRKYLQASERNTQALTELNTFLQSFVEQSPPPEQNGLRRIVRDPSPAENALGLAPADIGTDESKCIFYPDEATWIRDRRFLEMTFLGLEADLLLHDILTFNIADLMFDSPATSILLTYLMHLLLVQIRGKLGQANTANKTHVDDRFLI